MENVTQVHGKKNAADFAKWCAFLESKGYKNYWQDMNAKDYGVAQNRNRCFMVSTLYNEPYIFPQPVELTKCLRDYLEENVEDKYYLSDKNINVERLTKQAFNAALNNKGQKNDIIEPFHNRVNKSGILPTLTTRPEGLKTALLLIDNTQGFESEPRVYDKYAPALRASRSGLKTVQDYRIRKLTPRECWHLMSFSDSDFDKAATVCSNTQLYKQAGNSIVVECLKAIFSKMFA